MPPRSTHRHRPHPAARGGHPAARRTGRPRWAAPVRLEGAGAPAGAAIDLAVEVPGFGARDRAAAPAVQVDPVPADPVGGPDPVAGGYAHGDLLALARTIQSAALAEDGEALAAAVQVLRDGLQRHVASERGDQDHLPAALRAVVFGGQDRLLRLVDRIAADVATSGACACVRYGAELVVALRRQAALESAALRRPAGDRTSG